MRRLLITLLVLSTLSLRAQTEPEWLTDLRAVASKLGAKDVTVSVLVVDHTPEVKAIAALPKTLAELETALLALPTKDRRERAFKTLEPFTVWQPKPGFTEEGLQHGMGHK